MGDIDNSLQEKLKEEVWAIFFLGSFSYCTYTLVKSINEFSNNNVLLQISTVEDLPATFPAVTFCNLNPINELYSAKLLSETFQKMKNQFNCSLSSNFSLDDCYSKCGNISKVYNIYNNCILSCSTSNEMETTNYSFFGYSSYCTYDCDLLFSTAYSNYTYCQNACYDANDYCDRLFFANNSKSVLIDKIKRILANRNLTEYDHFFYGFDLNSDMLISCEYNKVQCSADNFTKYWDNQYGNCYTFNKGNDTIQPLKSSLTGESHGLVMQLIVIPFDANITYGYKTGIRLSVHNQSEQSFTLDKAISIQPGIETYVSVNREFKNKLPSPYSDCLSDISKPPNDYAQTLFTYFKDLNVTYYDQDFCFTICFQDKLIDKCNCSDIITPAIRNDQYCETDNELLCLNSFNNIFSKSDLNSLCENACKHQCQSVEYKLSLSTSAFPTLSYAQDIKKTFSRFFPYINTDSELMEFLKKGFLRFNVNYDNLRYTSVDEVPAVTFNGLLGNLGGQLGLFIGISILSFVEVIELLIACCIITYKHYN